MTVSEPVTQQTDPAAGADPAAVEQVAVDHVRRHGRTCYWDLEECRWRCG